MNGLLLIDRDGTLIAEPADCQVDRLEKVSLLPGVIGALTKLRAAGYRFVMVSNQDGLGTASFPERDFRAPQDFLLGLLAGEGIEFEAVLICPHRPDEGCACRKPDTALVTGWLAGRALDPATSAVIGDRDTDLELARRLGIPGHRVRLGGEPGETWPALAERLCAGLHRTGRERRATRETSVDVEVDLDREGDVRIHTGIGFFDHMLEQVARHGGFSLHLTAQGDLHVDEHHTVEDTALALGSALRRALGDKAGIARYGFVLPMDEARASVALDLSGRAHFVFKGRFRRAEVGGLPTELVAHFFHSLADTLGATLHLEVTGGNTHHMVEACFKCVGRALRQAIRVEGGAVPSSKGVL